MTWVDFVGQIGGLLGLCIGFSLLSGKIQLKGTLNRSFSIQVSLRLYKSDLRILTFKHFLEKQQNIAHY